MNELSNKEKILKAASAILLDKGLGSLSVRAIAQDAGLSTIAIYSHFENKQGVLDALYIEGFSLVREAVESTRDTEDPVIAAIKSGEAYLDIAHYNEGHYRLIFGETGSQYLPSPDAQRAANEAFDVLVRHVAALLPPDASPGSKQRAALRVWATLHGYVSLRHHVIGQLMDYQQWRNMTLDSFEKVVKDLKETAPLSGLV
ncbi:MAG: TetR/AcrR family transcriptional regulator [Pseudomonadota bacterium]